VPKVSKLLCAKVTNLVGNLFLKNTLGDPMYTTRRKTGFVGFLVAIDSIKSIFFDLVEKEEAPMNYILTYKFSQDHLELFFNWCNSVFRWV
jgi:hypothetical protein